MAVKSRRSPTIQLPDGFGTTKDWAVEFDSTETSLNGVYIEYVVFRSGYVRWEVLAPFDTTEHWECHFDRLHDDGGDLITPTYDRKPRLTEVSRGAFLA
jgi:hypothetical protein